MSFNINNTENEKAMNFNVVSSKDIVPVTNRTKRLDKERIENELQEAENKQREEEEALAAERHRVLQEREEAKRKNVKNQKQVALENRKKEEEKLRKSLDGGLNLELEKIKHNLTHASYNLTGMQLNPIRLRLTTQVMISNTSIRSLSLCNRGLNDSDCKILSELIISSKNLVEVNLSNNAFTSIGMRRIIKAISKNPLFRGIKVSNNTIWTRHSLVALKYWIFTNTKLNIIDFSSTDFPVIGVVYLSKYLKKLESMGFYSQEINLNGNPRLSPRLLLGIRSYVLEGKFRLNCFNTIKTAKEFNTSVAIILAIEKSFCQSSIILSNCLDKLDKLIQLKLRDIFEIVSENQYQGTFENLISEVMVKYNDRNPH